MKGDKPIAVKREQNLSVTGWEKAKPSGNGVFRSIQIQVSYPTKETRDLPKENREYKQVQVSVSLEQVDVLLKLINECRTEMTK